MTDIDNLVDQILMKNASRSPELVIWLLKSRGMDAVHVSGNKYKIEQTHEYMFVAQDKAKDTKKRLLRTCPELHVKNVDAYAAGFKSIVEFEVENGQ